VLHQKLQLLLAAASGALKSVFTLQPSWGEQIKQPQQL